MSLDIWWKTSYTSLSETEEESGHNWQALECCHLYSQKHVGVGQINPSQKNYLYSDFIRADMLKKSWKKEKKKILAIFDP